MGKTKNIYKGSFKEAIAMSFKRGNIWAMAIGVLIGTAFGAVITSLSKDIIMQAFALAGGDSNGIENLTVGTTKWIDTFSTTDKDPITGAFIRLSHIPQNGIFYGKFLSALLSFILITIFITLLTWMIIIAVRTAKIRKTRREAGKPAPIAAPTTDELILAELQKLNASLSKGTVKKTEAKKAVATVTKAKTTTTKKKSK